MGRCSVKVGVHVVDASNGRPVDSLPIRLEKLREDRWQIVWQGLTGADGRLDRSSADAEGFGEFQLVLETDRYFSTLGQQPFYSHIAVAFAGNAAELNQDVPVVVSPRCYVICAVGR